MDEERPPFWGNSWHWAVQESAKWWLDISAGPFLGRRSRSSTSKLPTSSQVTQEAPKSVTVVVPDDIPHPVSWVLDDATHLLPPPPSVPLAFADVPPSVSPQRSWLIPSPYRSCNHFQTSTAGSRQSYWGKLITTLTAKIQLLSFPAIVSIFLDLTKFRKELVGLTFTPLSFSEGIPDSDRPQTHADSAVVPDRDVPQPHPVLEVVPNA